MSDTAEALYRQLSFGCFQSHQSLALDEAESIGIKNGCELSRKFLQDVINGLGDGNIGPFLQTTDGHLLNRKQISTRIVKTPLGEINIKRFRCCSSENNNYYQLDAFLNLASSSFSHELRRRIAIEATKGSFSEVSSYFFETENIRVHQRQIEEIVVSASCDFDDCYNQRVTPESPQMSKHFPILTLSFISEEMVMRKKNLPEKAKKKMKKSIA